MTRRAALQLSAAAGVVGVGASQADAAVARDDVRREVTFDPGWRFHQGDVANAESPDFDDHTWRRIDVPHDWRIEDLPGSAPGDGEATKDPSLMAFKTRPSVDGEAPDRIGPFDANASSTPEIRLNLPGGNQGYTVAGVGWYRKTFAIPHDSSDRHLELRFDGVMYRSDIWVNGSHVRRNVYGFNSFTVDLTPHLRPGDNVVAVRADNSGATSRWYTGSGLYRHTWLTATGPVRVPVDGVTITTPEVGRTSKARVHVELENRRRRPVTARVRVTIEGPDGRVVARRLSGPRTAPSRNATAISLDVTIPKTRRWSLDNPHLYAAVVEVLEHGVVVDRVRRSFGIRTIAWDARRGFLLNGERVQLVGGNLHHDHGPLGAISLARSEERRLRILKRSGFNAIRTAHGPPSPLLLDACDRLGILVMAEFSDTWALPKAPDDFSKDFLKHWQSDLAAFVRRDRNHPSIISWSLGNEIFADPLNHGPAMADAVRSLDRTRPVTVGGFTLLTGLSGDSSKDPYWSYVDVGDSHYATDLTTQHAQHPGRPMTRSESYPSTIYADWKFDREHAWSAGSFVWAAWDYIGESGIGATIAVPPGTPLENLSLVQVLGSVPYPWHLAACSDFDLIGQPRAQHAWRRVVLGLSHLEVAVERPAPDGLQQVAARWTYYDELPNWTWDVPQGQLMRVRVYTAGDEVEVRVNARSIARRGVEEADHRVAVFDVPYEPGVLTVISRASGAEIVRKQLVTVGSPARLRLRSDTGRLRAAHDDLAHVLIEVLDQDGRRVRMQSTRSTFESVGPATWLVWPTETRTTSPAMGARSAGPSTGGRSRSSVGEVGQER